MNLKRIIYYLLIVLMFIWVGYIGWLFYFASCQTIKKVPLVMYAPNRCIK